MIIKNALIFHENGKFLPGDIVIHKDRIADIITEGNLSDGSAADSRAIDNSDIDASGLYAIPGLIDIHFHGCYGHDFCEGTTEAFDIISTYEAANGITSICPATMTLPEESLSKICEAAAGYENQKGSILSGIHLEGPFLSSAKKGAQNDAHLMKPDLAMFHRLNKLSGNRIRIVSIAPEEDGAIKFITELKDEVTLSLAHTTADYNMASKAFHQGARHVTHLFNAMSPFHHRDPGVVGAAFDASDVTVELICDGIHLHPGVVRAAVRLFGEDRVVFVSDSMMATGLPDGIYALGGQEVQVIGRKAVLTSDGTIAGSVTNLMECMKYAVRNMGIELSTAIKASTANPAKVIGIDMEYGSIAPGKYANIILLDTQLNIKAVIIKGKLFSGGNHANL